jgi:glycosyltransferase involved in cell wall biosynthesis
MPVISVVIPSYNHAAYIGEAIESVLTQTYEDWELIVIDDGSQDGSVDIISDYADNRITLITQENAGAHAAINRGISLAKGQFISILNSDDVYHRDRFTKLLPVIQRDENVVLVSSYIQLIDAAGRNCGIKRGYKNLEPWLLERQNLSFRAGADARLALLTENYLGTTSNFLFRKQALDHLGVFRALRFTHDWDFALRCMYYGELLLYPESLLKYRTHDKNTIRSNQAEMVFEICWCLAVHLPQYLPDLYKQDENTTGVLVGGLLNSIYTYKAGNVLSMMLLQRIAEFPQAALALLDPENESRKQYLDYLTHRLNHHQQTGPSLKTRILTRLNSLLHR